MKGRQTALTPQLSTDTEAFLDVHGMQQDAALNHLLDGGGIRQSCAALRPAAPEQGHSSLQAVRDKERRYSGTAYISVLACACETWELLCFLWRTWPH